MAAAPAAPPAQVSGTPADQAYEAQEEALPPRVVYTAPRAVVYVNPWPYLVIGGGWNSGWHGRWRRR